MTMAAQVGNRCFAFFFILLLIVGAAVIPARAQDKLIPLRVALGDVAIDKVPFILAKETGIFEKNGLDVTLYTVPGTADYAKRSVVVVPATLISNDPAEITISGTTPHSVSKVTDLRRLDNVVLATTDHVVRWTLFAQPEIKKVEQVKGKRIGFSGVGAMTHFEALLLCKKMGWDPVKDVSLMAGGLTTEVLKNHTADAIIADEFQAAMARKAGYQPLLELRTWNEPIGGSGILTTRTWVKEHPEAARRFVKSAVEGIALFKKDRNAAYAAMAKWWNITDSEVQKYMYDSAREMASKPYPAVDGIKLTMELYDSNEMRKHKPEDFYDDSFVRELDKSGFIDSLYK